MKEAKPEIWLVLLAQSGDREALNTLLQSVQEPLYRYILRLVGQPALADDILQEVFFRIYRKLHWLREPEWFRAWAYRIASREALKQLQRERRWNEQVRDDEVLEALTDPRAEESASSALLEQLPHWVVRVSPASRAVLILHYLHEMPLAEIADVLGISIGTVKSRLAYGLASLRRLLHQPGEKTDAR